MHGRGQKPVRSRHLGGIRRNAGTQSRRLITRRSQVQILPPLLRKAPETAPFASLVSAAPLASLVSGLAFRQICFFLPERPTDVGVVAAEVVADPARRVP